MRVAGVNAEQDSKSFLRRAWVSVRGVKGGLKGPTARTGAPNTRRKYESGNVNYLEASRTLARERWMAEIVVKNSLKGLQRTYLAWGLKGIV